MRALKTHTAAPHWISRLCVAGLMAGLLGGCSTVGTNEAGDSALPNDGPQMLDIYDQHNQASGNRALPGARQQLSARDVRRGEADLHGFTRQAHNETQALFPRLPNPALVMYVFPHLAGEGVGVPGYATSFPMYEKPVYALPGEAAAPWPQLRVHP